MDSNDAANWSSTALIGFMGTLFAIWKLKVEQVVAGKKAERAEKKAKANGGTAPKPIDEQTHAIVCEMKSDLETTSTNLGVVGKAVEKLNGTVGTLEKTVSDQGLKVNTMWKRSEAKIARLEAKE